MLLEVKGLTTTFATAAGDLRATDAVDIQLTKGEILGIIGESGAGKTTLAKSLLRLLPRDGTTTTGTVVFRGEDLSAASPARVKAIRGNEIAMIFQQPTSALNPVIPIGKQLDESLRLHAPRLDKSQRRTRLRASLIEAGITEPDDCIRSFPHQLSTGMCQRVMIAMALVCTPALLIADEPTASVDTVVQAQLLALLRQIRNSHGTAIILITHTLGVIAELCDKVAVMYAGQIVERGPTATVFNTPRHPYTAALLRAAPIPGLETETERFVTIPGAPPQVTQKLAGCRFQPRCARADTRCITDAPSPISLHNHVRCHFPLETDDGHDS